MAKNGHSEHPYLRQLGADPPPGQKPRHNLRPPEIVPQLGPPILDTRNAALLADMKHLLQYANIHPMLEAEIGLVAAKIVHWSELGADPVKVQHLWDWLNHRIIAMTSRSGYRADQTERVLIAEHQAKARLESINSIGAMGPRPKEPE